MLAHCHLDHHVDHRRALYYPGVRQEVRRGPYVCVSLPACRDRLQDCEGYANTWLRIARFSDEMLVARYNEAKGSAGALHQNCNRPSRNAIVAVLLAATWLAAHRE